MVAKSCPSRFTGNISFRNRSPGCCEVSALAFLSQPVFCKTSFLAPRSPGSLARWGGKRAACEGRNEIPERVCSCRAQPSACCAPAASRQPRSFWRGEKRARAICSMTSQEGEDGLAEEWFQFSLFAFP